MDELTTAESVELFVLILVADGTLPPWAWADFRQRLSPPAPRPDPAPGVEFAPRELPEPVAARVCDGIAVLAADNPRREAEAAARPKDERRRRATAAAARITRAVRDLRTLGCQFDVEITPRDSD
jgi:hypothetical protein